MKRLGILTPSSNTVLEPATARLVAPLAGEMSVHFARFPVTTITDQPASHDQFAIEPMIAAARLLADAGVDAILWSGTSGAWEGIDADRRLVVAIGSATGVAATTSTLALLDAFEALGVSRYGLVVPYIEPIVEAIVRNLAALGYACSARTAEGLTMNRDFAEMPVTALTERVRDVARSRPDAVVIHCTNLRGAEVVDALEAELDLPILDSVAIGLWGAFRLLGLPAPETLGRLATVGRQSAERHV
jgi:maleate isomerase